MTSADGATGLEPTAPARRLRRRRASARCSRSPTESGYYRAVARLGIQVAEALAHAHGQGVLHRDIKPSNLLLDVDGHVWVTDFGLAKLEGSDGPTQTGDIVGTLRYMAPERFEGWSDRRSDLYGLGMTLYELLTLRPAFEAATRAKLIDQVIHDPPPSPRKHDPRIPRDLETIVLEGDRQGAGGAVCDGGGTVGGPGEFRDGQADRGAAEQPARAGLAVVPAQPGGGGALGVTGLAVLTLVGLGVALSYQSRLRAAYSTVARSRLITSGRFSTQTGSSSPIASWMITILTGPRNCSRNARTSVGAGNGITSSGNAMQSSAA